MKKEKNTCDCLIAIPYGQGGMSKKVHNVWMTCGGEAYGLKTIHAHQWDVYRVVIRNVFGSFI